MGFPLAVVATGGSNECDVVDVLSVENNVDAGLSQLRGNGGLFHDARTVICRFTNGTVRRVPLGCVVPSGYLFRNFVAAPSADAE